FPNPVRHQIQVVSELSGDFEFKIFDLMGKQMSQIQVSERSINVSQLPTGMYILMIELEQRVLAKRIVIQR
ncbi:MAG: T9SS type A sorting domain-containing protein, partial [Bacteroidota bacterium]